jgi:hypothetical protein
MAGTPSTDLVQPGHRLLDQRPYQPAQPPRPATQLARCAGTPRTAAHPAARSQPGAGTSTGRLTATTNPRPSDQLAEPTNGATT